MVKMALLVAVAILDLKVLQEILVNLEDQDDWDPQALLGPKAHADHVEIRV